MTKRNRIFAGILVAYALGVAFLMYRQLADIDPRYRESAEESLVETAQLLAALIEHASPDGALRVEALEPVFRTVYARRFKADIYGVEKTRVELRATVIDRWGKVVFDSRGAELGADHSRWHDVFLALRGEYGARTTADIEGDPRTSVMYVACRSTTCRRPAAGEIVGAVSVGKPVQSFGQFVEAARKKTLLLGATSVVAVLLLVIILSLWLVRPFGVLADYVRYVREQRSFSLPRLGRRALGRDRRRLRRDARRARRPQLRRRLRADADPRGQGPALGDPRRRRAAAGADARGRPDPLHRQHRARDAADPGAGRPHARADRARVAEEPRPGDAGAAGRARRRGGGQRRAVGPGARTDDRAGRAGNRPRRSSAMPSCCSAPSPT